MLRHVLCTMVEQRMVSSVWEGIEFVHRLGVDLERAHPSLCGAARLVARSREPRASSSEPRAASLEPDSEPRQQASQGRLGGRAYARVVCLSGSKSANKRLA